MRGRFATNVTIALGCDRLWAIRSPRVSCYEASDRELKVQGFSCSASRFFRPGGEEIDKRESGKLSRR